MRNLGFHEKQKKIKTGASTGFSLSALSSQSPTPSRTPFPASKSRASRSISRSPALTGIPARLQSPTPSTFSHQPLSAVRGW